MAMSHVTHEISSCLFLGRYIIFNEPLKTFRSILLGETFVWQHHTINIGCFLESVGVKLSNWEYPSLFSMSP